MNKVDLDEAITVTTTVVQAILSSMPSASGLTAAKARYACGLLTSDGKTLLANDRLGFFLWLIAAFDTAQLAGATYEKMDAVRQIAVAITPSGLAAKAVRNMAVRLSLVEQARILAATDFKSRDDVDSYFNRINAAFDAAEIEAADNLDNIAYKMLIELHAAVSNDLANRSRPLPRMVSYTFPKRFPALTLAHRLYTDASRANELVDENDPIHPLFMGPNISALSQ